MHGGIIYIAKNSGNGFVVVQDNSFFNENDADDNLAIL